MIDAISTKALLLFAIVFQLFQRALYFSIGEDISTQLHATVNFAKGKGITINEVIANDLGNPISKLLSDWPIGYTLLLTPLFKLTNNILWSAMILDLVFVSLLLILIYKVLKQIGVEEQAIKVALLFFAISSTPFIYTSRTGVLSICCLLFAIWYLLKLVEREHINWIHAGFCGFLFVLPIWFRYAYMPLVAVPILFFGLKWLLTRDVNFVKNAFVCLLVVLISIFGIQSIQNAFVGQRNYLAESQGFGFHFSNLVYLKEFLFKGLFYVDPVIDFTNKNYLLKLGFKIVGLLLSTIVLIKLLVTAFKNRMEKNGNFEIIAMIAICLNLSLLIYLSLKYSNFHLTDYSWTFIQETRYFLPSILLLIIFMFKNYSETWIRNVLNVAVGFAGVMLIAGIVQIAIAGPTDKFYYKHHENFTIIKQELLDINEPFVFSTEANEIALRNLIATEGHRIFSGNVIENLKENKFHSKSPITLITKFTKEDYLENKVLLENRGSQKVFENEQFILVKTKVPFG